MTPGPALSQTMATIKSEVTIRDPEALLKAAAADQAAAIATATAELTRERDELRELSQRATAQSASEFEPH